MKVMKFGGTSVGQPERMRQVASLITRDTEEKVVVLSALSGTTNALVEIGNALSKGNSQLAKQHIDKLYVHYTHFIASLFQDSTVKAEATKIIDEHFDFLNIILKISHSDALNKDILAQGELMSTKLFSLHLKETGVPHALIPALEFMRINANDEPNLTYLKEKLPQQLAAHPDKKIFVTQGYICRNAKGEVDNLKRGGSDYTASLIAAALSASVCEIWTDIDGMHNNDPRIVDKTRPIEILSFDEAAELAYFGAKILHPTCVWPAQQSHVPVKLLNTMAPDAKGTTIQKTTTDVGPKAVAAKDGIIAIKIKSSRMLLAYGFLRKIFEVFEKYQTPIDMITTSEVAVSLTIDSDVALKEIIAELQPFGEVIVDKDQSIISIVGNNIGEKKDFLQQTFAAIGNIPIRMISFGGSRHNISFLVASNYRNEILQKINTGIFGL